MSDRRYVQFHFAKSGPIGTAMSATEADDLVTRWRDGNDEVLSFDALVMPDELPCGVTHHVRLGAVTRIDVKLPQAC